MSTNATIRDYRTERKQGTLARIALSHARTNAAWRARECGEHDEPEVGDVRLRVEPDEFVDLDNLFGDCFDAEVNDNIPASRLERERKAEVERVERDGVCGVIGEYWNGDKWVHVDSCWGFIGEDWKSSGYDSDIKRATLDAANAFAAAVNA